MRIRPEQLRLYAITDRKELNGASLPEAVEDVLKGGATVIQLREKSLSDSEFIEMARSIRPICTKYGVPLIINDSIPAALASQADGVHIGLNDISIAEARRIMGPNKIIGASAHNVSEAMRAQMDGADYLGCGAVFHSSTKKDVVELAPDELWRICKAVSIPVVAIGGITIQNAPTLTRTGVSGLAVVSALFSAPDRTEAARTLRAIVDTIDAEASYEDSLNVRRHS